MQRGREKGELGRGRGREEVMESYQKYVKSMYREGMEEGGGREEGEWREVGICSEGLFSRPASSSLLPSLLLASSSLPPTPFLPYLL
jgi:hypothetical protein